MRTTPTPVDELPPVRRQLHRLQFTEPVWDWEELDRRRAADPDLAAEKAFANWIVFGKTETPPPPRRREA